MSRPPTVSCLMVTADRPILAQRAILAYQQQTYPDKELVVLDNGEAPIQHLLADLPDKEVRYQYVEKEPGTWIGALRNQSLDLATGDLIVPQWDDDDWSHPERLDRQVAFLQRHELDACTLAGTLMHVDNPRYFFHPFIGLLRGGVPPTILHRREDAIRFPNLRRTSDTTYTNAWQERRYAQLPVGDSYLYLRYFHGGNLWEEEHFLRRARNTPRDLLAWGWWRYVRRDPFRHPRFRLTPAMWAAFERYLRDSFRFDLFHAVTREEWQSRQAA